MTQEQFDQHVAEKLYQILKAAEDYHNNPEKAKEHIIHSVKNICKASKMLGEMAVVDELFN
jgi:pantothenate synthetase